MARFSLASKLLGVKFMGTLLDYSKSGGNIEIGGQSLSSDCNAIVFQWMIKPLV